MRCFTLEPSDTLVLQEKVVYSFNQSQISRRLPNSTHQLHHSPGRCSKAPDTILLCLWPQATSVQVDHYIAGYRELYPSARLILSRCNNASSFRADEKEHETTLNKLINAQPSLISSSSSRYTQTGIHYAQQPPSVLLHLFGTSGAEGACRLLRSFRSRTGKPLNVGAVVADTEPSTSLSTFLTSSQPFSSTLFSFILAFWMRLQEYMFFRPPESQSGQVHQDLNNPTLLPSDARKCFVFAHRGLMLSWMKNSLPRSNATSLSCGNVGPLDTCNEEQDERREYAFRRSSIDQKGRWSGDQERYWSGIEEVWGGR